MGCLQNQFCFLSASYKAAFANCPKLLLVMSEVSFEMKIRMENLYTSNKKLSPRQAKERSMFAVSKTENPPIAVYQYIASSAKCLVSCDAIIFKPDRKCCPGDFSVGCGTSHIGTKSTFNCVFVRIGAFSQIVCMRVDRQLLHFLFLI